MEVFNATPYTFLPFDCSPAPSLPALSLIVKGAFRLRPELPPVALEKNAQPQMKGDEMHMDDLGRSLSYASDLVPLKLRGEVLVNAVCYAPLGRPRPYCDVAIAVGPIQKALRVTGDRAWTRDAHGRPTIGRVQPFESLPIRWERAFGGLSFPANPLGLGAEPAPDDAGRMTHALPNIEYLDRRIADLQDRPPPAGLGPVSPSWEPRLRRQGTRDQRWAMFRAPLAPKDFDPLFHNAAPDDQQLPEGYFRGDEPIVVTGLHREIASYRSCLPGKRLRLFLLARRPEPEAPAPGRAPSRFVEMEMKLDTVHLDMEKEELVLLWRRPVALKTQAHLAIEAVYIAEEELASEPLSIDAHYARFEALRGPKEPSVSAEAQAEIAEQLAEAKKILRESKADPAVVAAVERSDDPQAIFKLLTDYAKEQIKDIERLTATFKRPPSA